MSIGVKTPYSASDWFSKDLPASLTVVCLAAPQCIAYAIIAGIPPVVGLYAATIPTMVAALLRSSRLTVTGPTNAISLLVFTGVMALPSESATVVAFTLALMAGVMQLILYLCRLENLISFVSQPVVVGYITGAAVLIGISQLPNISRTIAVGDTILQQVYSWVNHLSDAHGPSIGVGISTIAGTLVLRHWNKKLPADMLALVVVTAAVYAVGKDLGIRCVQDLSPIPKGLPQLSIPKIGLMVDLAPLAFAIAMLSLVESTSVSRSIASRIGEAIDLRKEVLGQALANISAGFLSGYPTSGSLARSALNESSQAASRMSAFMSGVWMILIILIFGDAVNHVPLPALGGLLLLIAYRLVRISVIKNILRSTRSDRWALIATMIGTWLLPLDKAIYAGVVISIVGFLQRTRKLSSTPIRLDPYGYVEATVSKPQHETDSICQNINIVQIEGTLYFASENSLMESLNNTVLHTKSENIIVRFRRTQHMDYTIANTLIIAAKNLHKQNRRLFIVGLKSEEAHWLHSVDSDGVFNETNVYPTQTRWFDAMHRAIEHAATTSNCAKSICCPLQHHLKSPNAPQH